MRRKVEFGTGAGVDLIATAAAALGAPRVAWVAVALIGLGLVVYSLWPRRKEEIELASDELGRIIAEGRDLKAPVFEFRHNPKPTWGEVKRWWDSTAIFIEAVFGPLERDAFMKPVESNAINPWKRNYDDEVKVHCDRLRDLARRLRDTDEPARMIRVSRRNLRRLGAQQQKEARG